MSFQRRGKEHIRHIFDMAKNEWCQSNWKTPFDTCLLHAMEKHRDYMIKLEREAFRRSSVRCESALND
jgi:hypothetical protein